MRNLEAKERQSVIVEARSWLGTPYHHMGRVKGAGVDCAMVLLEVYRACGLIPHIEIPYYPQDWALHRSEEKYLDWIEKYSARVEVSQPGDIALYKFGRCISHGAIVIDWPSIIHAYIGEGCVLADGTKGQLEGRLYAFYSLWGSR